MNSARLSAIQKRLQKALSPRRYAHSLGTARFAAALAERYGVNAQRAYLAGLLHDCARDLDAQPLAKILKHYRGRYFDSATRAMPALWHNPAGVYLARHTYQIKDPLILRAIARHSTGAPDMTLLDKLIYVADFAEPTRRYPSAADNRVLALRDLDQAIPVIVREKIWSLRAAGQSIHPMTMALAKQLRIPQRSIDQGDQTGVCFKSNN